jgi:Fe-S-cluster containining protein
MKKSEYLDICQKCKASCCKLGGTNLTKEEVDRVLNKGFENNFVEVKPGIYELKADENGVCPYLEEDHSCKIHDVKPLICTCWPIFPEYDRGKINHELINCPLAKQMSEEEIEKCRKESLCVSLDIAKCSADESSTPIHQIELIKKRYEEIESSEIK